jgi:hypothetical protein
MQNNVGMPGAQYPGQGTSSVSPVSHQAPMSQGPQNAIFAMGNQGHSNGDPRAVPAPPQTGLPSGLNVNNLTPQQRQFLMQQSRGGGGGNSNPPMMMNPQQAAYAQHQQQQMHHERLRQEHQQRLQSQHAGSPTHGSPMPLPGNDSFPALRSNPAISGIARSTRSPSDSAPSPMTPRAPTRGPSLGQDDYQRGLMQQAQSRAMAVQSPAFNQHIQAPTWQQNQQQQQQQAMQMGHGQGTSFGMTSPGSTGLSVSPYGGAPSPPNSQNWAQGGAYPFAPSPGQSDHAQTPRHMSATPVPQQQQLLQPQTTSPPAEAFGASDFDIFNWAQ